MTASAKDQNSERRELRAEGEHTILVSTSDESQALAVLVLDHAVCAAQRTADGILVTLRPGEDPEIAASAVIGRLVEAGVNMRVPAAERNANGH